MSEPLRDSAPAQAFPAGNDGGSLDVEEVDASELLESSPPPGAPSSGVTRGGERLRATMPLPSRFELEPRTPSSPARPRQMSLREGSIIGGRYRVDRVGARTESTLILSATHMELGHPVTLLCFVPTNGLRSSAATGFLRQARTFAQIKSEHAARILDIGKLSTGHPLVVLESLRGWDLEEVLRVRGPLPVQEAVEYVIQSAEPVASAHALGVVYGGLTLRSLFLTRLADGSPFIKLVGSGVLGALDTLGAVDGSLDAPATALPFSAPEQVRAEGIDGRVDVWALGAVLYTLLAGVPPFLGRTVAATLASVCTDDPAALSELRGDITPELEAVVLRCLAKDREERFSGVADFLSALRPFASGDALQVVERASRLIGAGSMAPPPPSTRPAGLVPAPRTIPPPSRVASRPVSIPVGAPVSTAPVAHSAPHPAVAATAAASSGNTFVTSAFGAMAGMAVVLFLVATLRPHAFDAPTPASVAAPAAPAAAPVAVAPQSSLALPAPSVAPTAATVKRVVAVAKKAQDPSTAAVAAAVASSSPGAAHGPSTAVSKGTVATSSPSGDLFDDSR